MALVPSTTTATYKSITLGPGECVVLPKGAEITSIITNGSITATSTCGDLPTPSAYKCGLFAFFLDAEGGALGAMEEDQVLVVSVKVGNTTYIINEYPATIVMESEYNVHITDQALFKFMAIRTAPLEDRELYYLYFQAPEDLWSTIELKITDRGTAYYLKPNDATCGEYPDPE